MTSNYMHEVGEWAPRIEVVPLAFEPQGDLMTLDLRGGMKCCLVVEESSIRR